MSRSSSQAVIRPRDWLARAQAVIDATCADLAPADAATLRSAFRRLARAVRALPMTAVRIPLAFNSSLLGQLTRLRTTTGVSREAWEGALRQVFAVLSAAGLAREPRNVDVRGQRRSTAVALDPEAFALLPRLQALRTRLLQMDAPFDRHEETAVVGAVLSTVVFSGITIPHLREALVCLERDALDVDIGCLMLPVRGSASCVTPGPRCQQRFALHPVSLIHWGRLLLCRPHDVPESSAPTHPLLPSGWRDPKQLRAALRRTLKAAGFPTWPRFLRTVRIEMLLTIQAPV